MQNGGSECTEIVDPNQARCMHSDESLERPFSFVHQNNTKFLDDYTIVARAEQ